MGSLWPTPDGAPARQLRVTRQWSYPRPRGLFKWGFVPLASLSTVGVYYVVGRNTFSYVEGTSIHTSTPNPSSLA